MRLSRAALQKVVFGAFGLAILLALGYVVTRSGPLAPIRVTVTNVETGTIAPALYGIGTVEARRAHLIGPTAAGRVRRVLVDVGDVVEAGQLLAEMEPVDLDERVAATASALARGQSAVVGAEAQLRDAQSLQVLTTAEARRALDLGRAGIVSQSNVDAAQQANAASDARVAAAEATLAAARRARTRLDADRGGAVQQRANVRLLAPADGIVTSRDAEPGSTVVAGQAVLKMLDPTSLWVNLRLDQGRSAGLEVGLPAHIVRRASPQETLAGRVARVEPISDSVTEERLCKVSFDSIPPGLSLAEMVEVTLTLPPVTGALTIPNASVRHRGSQAGAWRLTNGTLEFVALTLGAEGVEGRVQVLEGLRAGDTVVVYSERDLSDGSHPQVVPSLDGTVMISLAGRDILHSSGRFILTGLGLPSTAA